MKEHKTIGHVATRSEPHVTWVHEDHQLRLSVSDDSVLLEGYRLSPARARQLAAMLTTGAALVTDCKLADESNPPPFWRDRWGTLN